MKRSVGGVPVGQAGKELKGRAHHMLPDAVVVFGVPRCLKVLGNHRTHARGWANGLSGVHHCQVDWWLHRWQLARGQASIPKAIVNLNVARGRAGVLEVDT